MPEQAPSLEEWKGLYEAAVRLRELAPWEWMYDSDIFGVKNPYTGEVGYCCVLGRVYGKNVPATSGPLPCDHEARGDEMVVSFVHADGGLAAKEGSVKGFEIAGDDGQWKPAACRIEGNKVIVSNPDVKKPSAVRYAWACNPDCNLVNGAGLPASPFRRKN